MKIIIIGGGFGGTYTARFLRKALGNKADIKVFSKSNYFLFTPLLHEVAMGGLSARNVVEPIQEIFRGENIEFIKEEIINIDKGTKSIETTERSYPYDYLVVSTGAQTEYYGIPGAKENTLPLKSIEDAVRMRNAIIKSVDDAVKNNNKKYLRYVVVGGGATGVEVVSELAEYVKTIINSYHTGSNISAKDVSITIITNTDSLIPQFPEKMRILAKDRLEDIGVDIKTNSTVSDIKEGIINFKDGSSLEYEIAIWVAGVSPMAKNINGIDLDPKGRIETNEYLQSLQDATVFSLGDSGSHYPMLAQVAVRQAETVADNIKALAGGDNMKPYSKDIKGLLLSLGHFSAIGQIGGRTLHGPMMWFIWRTIYLFNFHSWKNRFKIALEWTINLFVPRDITRLD